MNWLSDRHWNEILQALENLGFDQPLTLLTKMEACEDPRDSLVRSIILHDQPIDAKNDINLALFIKEEIDGSWYIDKVIAQFDFETERNEEGRIDLRIEHRREEGPIPGIESLCTDFRVILQEEAARESYFLRFNLEKEFERMGFDNYYEMLRSAHPEAGFTVLETYQRIEPREGTFLPFARFEFVVSQPDQTAPAVIWMVRASLVETGLEKPRIIYEADRGFYRFNGQLPDKSQMTKELLCFAKFPADQHVTVRKRFRIGELASEYGSMHPIIQRKLRL